MRLPKPFYRLPRRFDVARLRAEVAALPAAAWAPHPNSIPGNSSVRLISVEGGENDHVDGEMRATAHLARTPYIRQVLASFGVPWSRSRLLKLAPGATVPQHADINYHWFYRVRLHVPVVTREEVRFTCDGTTVHMAAGEAWVFDNWRLHEVVNPTPDERIHLVADTAGNAAFWQLVAASDDPAAPVVSVPFEPRSDPVLLTERSRLRPVMNPAEVDLLVGNMRAELVPASDSASAQLPLYHALLDSFVRDWRHFYSLHGEEPAGWPDFAQLRERLRSASRTLGSGIALRINRVAAHSVLEGRVLRAVLPGVAEEASTPAAAPRAAPAPRRTASAAPVPRPQRPIFIVAAPRSGSTLLFETLAVSRRLHTLGGEAHWLVEDLTELRPGAPGVDSNRLTGEQFTEERAARIYASIAANIRDADNTLVPYGPGLRLLEKTPKNSLRIPFLDRLFPDASFVFLWRDPRENIASIMRAWRSGKWKTYNGLEGFPGPWSLLLPPGWRELRGKPLEEIAAHQWSVTNRLVLDDLAALAPGRWTSLSYGDFIADPRGQVTRLCRFLDIGVDPSLSTRLGASLPYSTFTLTPPRPDKWRELEPQVMRVVPGVEPVWRRLRDLSVAPGAGGQPGLRASTNSE
ncbi:MAG TPA: sulfotransferase [Steroidobacteraceae bacterium]|nr:sulfotransferase [Steroidobacteraceae bacterium]